MGPLLMTLQFELLTDSEATRRDFTQFVRIDGLASRVITADSYDRLRDAGAIFQNEDGFYGTQIEDGDAVNVECILTEDAYSLALHLAS